MIKLWSTHSSPIQRLLLHSKLLLHFEEIFTSFNFKCLKSDAKAFELLTKRLNEYGLNPEECLFVDDNLENVKRAKEKGYKIIHYQNFPEVEEIKKELENIFVF